MATGIKLTLQLGGTKIKGETFCCDNKTNFNQFKGRRFWVTDGQNYKFCVSSSKTTQKANQSDVTEVESLETRCQG